MQELLEKDEVGRVRLVMGTLRQKAEVVFQHPPTGGRTSDKSEECAGGRLRTIAAGKAAPPTEVRNESMQIEAAS